MHTNPNKYQVEKCPALPGWDLISSCNLRVEWKLSNLDGLKFHPGQLGSCNHHLRGIKTAGIVLLFYINEHCLERRSLRTLHFSLKLDMKLLLWNRSGITGILLLFNVFFSKDHWHLELVLTEDSFWGTFLW